MLSQREIRYFGLQILRANYAACRTKRIADIGSYGLIHNKFICMKLYINCYISYVVILVYIFSSKLC
jgi:hypothetical protein